MRCGRRPTPLLFGLRSSSGQPAPGGSVVIDAARTEQLAGTRGPWPRRTRPHENESDERERVVSGPLLRRECPINATGGVGPYVFPIVD